MLQRNCTQITRQQALSEYPNFAWKFLAAEILLEKENKPELKVISAINELLMIAVQKLNCQSHPAQSFFKKKLQSLMIRPSVNKTLLQNPNKRIVRQRRDVLSSCLNIQRAQRISRLKAFIAITQQNDPHLVLRMVQQSSQIIEKNSVSIHKQVDLQKQQIQNRIRQRRDKSIKSKQPSEAPLEEFQQFSEKKKKKASSEEQTERRGSRSVTSFDRQKNTQQIPNCSYL